MTSLDSIGSCSLDAFASASELSDLPEDAETLSARTLRSIAGISADAPPSAPSPTSPSSAQSPEYVRRTAKLFEPAANGTANGTTQPPPLPVADLPEPVVPSKKPSYLGLACSLSGYSGLTAYDSKLREGFRSRDRSPAAARLQSSLSPAPTASGPVTCSSSPSPLAPTAASTASPRKDALHGLMMNGTAGDYRRGFAGMNGSVAPADAPTAPATPPPRVNGSSSPPTSAAAALRQSSRSFMSSMLADDVDFVGRVKEQISSLSPAGGRSQELLQKQSPDSSKESLKDSLSPGSAQDASQKRSPGTVRVVEFTSQSKSYVRTVVSAKTVIQSSNSVDSSPFSSLSESTVTEMTAQQSSQSSQLRSSNAENVLTGSPKSFIQQRIERLYGPGALAQGFFSRTRQMSRSEDASSQQVTTVEESYIYVGSPEVLRPESSHTDTPRSGGSQSPSLPVLRHLRPEFRAQLPLTPGAPRSPRRTVKATDDSSVAAVSPTPHSPPILQHQTSIESITDSQPAAPDVPILAVDRPKSPVPLASSIPPPVEATPQVVIAPVIAHQPVKPEVAAVAPVEVPKTADSLEDKDGHYFLQVLHEEVVRLSALVESAESELNSEAAQHLPEEALGKLRAAAGKARLLMKQKLQQFEGLCHKNISQSPEEVFPTTAQDLAGFWDMVKLQVDHVDRLFLEIDKLRAAGWVEAASDSPSLTTVSSGATQRRRPPGVRRGASSQHGQQTPDQRQAAEAARKAREAARRQMMEERRRAMKQKQQQQQNVEIYVPAENGK